MAISIRLTDLASYKIYFNGLADEHKNIDGFKWGDKDIINNDNRSNLAPRFLWATPYERAKYGDKMSDNVHKSKTAKVAYMILQSSDLFASESAAFDFCEATIEQILSRILIDKRGKDVNGTWMMIITDINSWSSGPVEMIIGSTKYIGWELQITFQDPMNLIYDLTKWN